MPERTESPTALLRAWQEGEASAFDRLLPLVHNELRRIARRHMQQERGETLQATALVNEAYLRLVDLKRMRWEDRAHFFAMSARIMRRILVDYARARKSKKRGGDVEKVSLDATAVVSRSPSAELLALDEALLALAELHPRKAMVVEMRFFSGLTAEETADVLKVSPETVLRDWQFAKAWLRKELRGAR